MNFISFIKSKLRPFKNRLYSLSLYLKNYDDNDVRLNGANLRRVKIRIKGSGNRVYIDPAQTLENSNIFINSCGSVVCIRGGMLTI